MSITELGCCELISIQAPCQNHHARQPEPLETAFGDPARALCICMPVPKLWEAVFTFLPLAWPAVAKQAAREAWHYYLALVPVPSWHWPMPAGTGTVPSMPPWLCQAIPLQLWPEDWTCQLSLKLMLKTLEGLAISLQFPISKQLWHPGPDLQVSIIQMPESR